MNISELHKQIDSNVRQHGRMVIGVFPTKESTDPTNEAFLYTIGNHLKGMPELLLIGMCEDTYTVNNLSRIMLERGRKFDNGEMVNLGGKQSVCLIDASADVKENYTIQATQYLKTDDYAVMQVVLPDPSGHFPWQKGCTPPYAQVVVHRARSLH